LAGTRKELDLMGIFIVAFLTANGGGVLRDLLTNKVPEVLHSGFYGSVALIVGVILYTLHQAAQLTPIFIMLVFVGALILRLIAHGRNWQLPKISK
jgi:uncharacterized membrane protein YeiH